jgi:hypothetical protein
MLKYTRTHTHTHVGQAKFAYGGSILGSSKFTLLSRLPLKLKLNLKVLKSDSKITILLLLSKLLTHSVVILITMRKQKTILFLSSLQKLETVNINTIIIYKSLSLSKLRRLHKN